jgi:hypothetical protein
MIEPEQASDRFCRSCQHCLRGIASRQCPECGQPFDPNDPRTTWATPRGPFWNGVARLCLIISRGCFWLAIIAFIVVLLGYDHPRLAVLPCCVGFIAVWLWWAMMLSPWVPLTGRQRAAGLFWPLLLWSIEATRWPLVLCVFICPPWINFIADHTQSKGLTWGKPTPTIRRGAVIHNGNVGFLLMGDTSHGLYLVRVNPNPPPGSFNRVWINTNFEQSIGGQWYVVYQD